MSEVMERISRLESEGCGLGRVHTAEISSVKCDIAEIKKMNWWVITICFCTLVGMAMNIGMGCAALEKAHQPYQQKYPLP